jgi:hypothetical protein
MLFDLLLLGKLDAAGNADVIENRTPPHTDAKCLAPSELSGLNQNSRPQSSEPQLRLMRCRLFFQILFRFRDRRSPLGFVGREGLANIRLR